MLGGADTKKPFSLKMLDGAGIKKAPPSQYVRRCWHEKAVSTENAGEVAIKEAPQTQTQKISFHVKCHAGLV